MEEFFEESKINEWKKLILNNPARLQQENDVISKFGALFSRNNLDKLTKDDFKSFLLMKNNRHWEGIHRQGNIITEDMEKLRKALAVLIDESKPLKERLDYLFPLNKDGYIKGLGRAIVTPILMVTHPGKYGVYNSKSEAGLEQIGLLPKFKSKDSFADKYLQINDILNELAEKYGVTLWQLDEIIGCIALGNTPITTIDSDNIPSIDKAETAEDAEERYEEFGLESHLEDFLIENWDKLDISKKYQILEKDGDLVGQQYVTPIGRIDILAKSRDGREWLVIELKKGMTSDRVVGQTLRYIGWAKENLAGSDDKVTGLVIVGEKDEKLTYSLKAVDNIKLRTYSVSFKLSEIE